MFLSAIDSKGRSPWSYCLCLYAVVFVAMSPCIMLEFVRRVRLSIDLCQQHYQPQCLVFLLPGVSITSHIFFAHFFRSV